MSYYRNKREEREKLANDCLEIIGWLNSYFDNLNDKENGYPHDQVNCLEELRFKIIRMI